MRAKGSVRLAHDDAPAALLPWDTEFWGVRVAQVHGCRMNPHRLGEVDEWAAANAVDCLYFLAASDDPQIAHAAERGGFRVMDLRIELRRRADGDVPAGLRDSAPEDTDQLRAIARTSHGVTRFYADPNFPNARCDDLYETWITRSLEGWADGVLVADDDARAVGYVSCHLNAEQARGSIGLIAVDASARGAGIGVALTRGAAAWCAGRGMSEMSVVTQGRNAGAIRTFERGGFVTHAVQLWFHKWYGR